MEKKQVLKKEEHSLTVAYSPWILILPFLFYRHPQRIKEHPGWGNPNPVR
jgi:hypothetical protein